VCERERKRQRKGEKHVREKARERICVERSEGDREQPKREKESER